MFMYSYCYVCSVLYILFCANWHSSGILTEVFPCFSLSCKAIARVWLTKTGHSSHSSELGDNFYLVSSSLILFWPLWVQVPESLPTKVVSCVVLCIVCM